MPSPAALLRACAVLASGVALRMDQTRAPPEPLTRQTDYVIRSDEYEAYHVPLDFPPDAEIHWTGRRWSPHGWVVKRGSEDQRAYYDIHIPKTAGCSWSLDVPAVLPKGEGYFSMERCFNTTLGDPVLPKDKLLAIFREPRMHVYSQFLECKYDSWFVNMVPDKEKYLLETVTTWLKHFEGGEEKSDMRCYHPYNMQARTLTCSVPGSDGSHHYMHDINLKEALHNLQTLFFVGLVERYQASVCVFAAKVNTMNYLPPFCNCSDEQSWKTFKQHKITHGVPPHSIRNLTKEDVRLIDEMTQLDAAVYRKAKEIFERDVSKVESHFGVKLSC